MASAEVWSALPKTVWPISAAATPERSRACFAAAAPSSMADRSLSEPPKVPKPVRTPDRSTTSLWEPWVFMGEAPRQMRGISGIRRGGGRDERSEEHTSELQSQYDLV